ncbi:hypothetical protein KUCAC02_032209, partial [Chaenocephalus aceratus]
CVKIRAEGSFCRGPTAGDSSQSEETVGKRGRNKVCSERPSLPQHIRCQGVRVLGWK